MKTNKCDVEDGKLEFEKMDYFARIMYKGFIKNHNMKTNEKGMVELYDFQVDLMIGRLQNNIDILHNDKTAHSDLIAGFLQDDLNMFKRHCGYEKTI